YPIVLQKYLAAGNGTGIYVTPGTDHGDPSDNANVNVISNVAIHNQLGFELDMTGKAQYNTASNNVVAGFGLDPDLVYKWPFYSVFNHNAAIGNRGPGVLLYSESADPSMSGFADFSHNDFFGNDRNRPASLQNGLGHGPSAHCGVLNTGYSNPELEFGGFALGGKATTQYDYWGAASGPHAVGAGDAAGGVCDKNGAVTTVLPFSTSPYVFTSLP